MTFKHGKFDDSAVLRSLERVAVEKGLIKPEVMVKSASSIVEKNDFTITDNISYNIMKLCSKLRDSGFSKHADDIEINYLKYKKAQTLYETFNEKGEDLVNAAHPDGSHELEGVEGDAKFLTIIDKHLAIVRMLDKKPTGKLASSKKKFKLSLAEDPKRKMTGAEYKNKLIEDAKSETKLIKQRWHALYNSVTKEGAKKMQEPTSGKLEYHNDHTSAYNAFAKISQDALPNLATITILKSLLAAAKAEAAPGMFGGLTQELYNSVSANYDDITGRLDKLAGIIKQYENKEDTEIEVPDNAKTVDKDAAAQQEANKKKEDQDKAARATSTDWGALKYNALYAKLADNVKKSISDLTAKRNSLIEWQRSTYVEQRPNLKKWVVSKISYINSIFGNFSAKIQEIADLVLPNSKLKSIDGYVKTPNSNDYVKYDKYDQNAINILMDEECAKNKDRQEALAASAETYRQEFEKQIGYIKQVEPRIKVNAPKPNNKK